MHTCRPSKSEDACLLGVTNGISFHARVGYFSPFCIRGVWPLLYLWRNTGTQETRGDEDYKVKLNEITAMATLHRYKRGHTPLPGVNRASTYNDKHDWITIIISGGSTTTTITTTTTTTTSTNKIVVAVPVAGGLDGVDGGS